MSVAGLVLTHRKGKVNSVSAWELSAEVQGGNMENAKENSKWKPVLKLFVMMSYFSLVVSRKHHLDLKVGRFIIVLTKNLCQFLF